ncbi:MAG: hypothetical protein ACREO3_02850 [Arenimonas sp.]
MTESAWHERAVQAPIILWEGVSPDALFTLRVVATMDTASR